MIIGQEEGGLLLLNLRGMPMKKQKTILILFLFCIGLMLASCGSSAKAGTEAATEDPAVGFSSVHDYVVTTKNDTVIYRTADREGEHYITVESGVNLRRTGIKEGWSRIRLNDTTLYVESDCVKRTEMKWAEEQVKEKNSHVVFIDPAKQIYADSGEEQLFPDDPAVYPQMKKKMTKGAIGTATGTFEYEITLDVAEKLRHELELRGYTVILSRASSTISMSNAERAAAGNQSNAEIMIRLSAQGTSVSSTNGMLGFVEKAREDDTEGYYQDCFYLANALMTECCALTDAGRLGIFQTDQMVFLNYAKKPAASIQLGFLSNEEEDRKLSDEEYQKTLARGLANGIDTYFSYINGRNATDEAVGE